ncbi:hypothetical protein GPECTOR_14g49 [Gonium pectorale]|uniref:phytol kinase n=1 Tax=Gonium pectorale TaxID=33097 RepID=A0A150GMJ4_GONPE|nr:hypothetical protein GPECTOR_14g49 [Gonium pectorale]|eukprot:KXZ51063.1 hypothetical protein GPECTOR_14g49 [Gonium pectorale]
MGHPLSQAVVLVVCTTTLLAGEAAGSFEGVASRPEVADLLLSHLVFLSLNPVVLLAPSGLGTAQRCLQLCWELTRAPSPHCKGLRELLQRVDLAGRLMQLAATALYGGAGASGALANTATAAGSESADTAAALATMAVLESLRTPAAGGADTAANDAVAEAVAARGAAAAGEAAAASVDPATFEDRLSLAGQACSLMSNLGGLGTRGIELSASGLAPQRNWLLGRGRLAAMRPALEGLIDGLAELRRRMEHAVPGEEEAELKAAEEEAQRAGSEEAELRPGRVRRARLLDQVEGAVRNALMLLGLPTIVMGRSEEEAVEGCSFTIRLSFELFKEGYVDTMRALRSSVADPVGPGTSASAASGVEACAAPYPGDYGPFFRAYAGHLETMMVALGVQLEDWGVCFTSEQLEREMPVMQVNEGVDVRIAQAWLKDQIQQVINWGHTMMTLVRMADQAKMDRRQPAQAAQQAGMKPTAGDAASALAAAAAAPTANCASCGAAPPAGGPPLQSCSGCRRVRYCSRACQVAHWPEHKGPCKAAKASAGESVTAGSAAGQVAAAGGSATGKAAE